MKKLFIATSNTHKVGEIRQIIGDDIEIVTPKDLCIDIDVEENGTTFKENAMIKALSYRDYMRDNNIDINDYLIVADDSGLEIDALGGEPGIHSARYLGEDVSHDKRMDYILEKLEGLEFDKRSAHFNCVLCVIDGDDINFIEELVNGHIAESKSGTNGFGYDPIFIFDEYDKPTADLPIEMKHKIGHRGRAFTKLKERYYA